MDRYKKIGIIIVGFTFIFLYGITFYPHTASIPTGSSLESFSCNHWLGTDNLGCDIFAQISEGYFRSMGIGLVVAMCSFLVGGSMGVMAGYMGGDVDAVVSFLIHVFLSVPQLPIMIVIGAFLGQETRNVILILVLFSWASIAKQVRAKTQSIVEKEYIMIAQKYGGSPWYIFRTHMALEIMPLLTVISIGIIGKAVIAEASLAFLGLSDPTAASWGMMMKKAMSFSGIYYTEFWKWWLMSPVFALIIMIVSVRLFAKELELHWIERMRNE